MSFIVLMYSSISRYLVFYSPFDLAYKISRLLPFKMVLAGFKEVQRAHKVYHAVSHTAKLYPNSYLVIVIIGTVKGKVSLLEYHNEKWARPWENVSYAICEQQRHRSACACAQSDQHLCCSLPRQNNTSSLYIRNFKILAGLCSWAGQFESCLVVDSRRHIFSWRGSVIDWIGRNQLILFMHEEYWLHIQMILVMVCYHDKHVTCFSMTWYIHYSSNVIWQTVSRRVDELIWAHPRDVIQNASSSYYYDNIIYMFLS